VVDNQDAATALFPERVGDRLRAARLAAGIDLSDVATKTRVPLRHLQAIEGGDYASLPGSTYCIGFVKAFARVVGVDEESATNDLRTELRDLNLDQRAERIEYQVADATRLPSKTLTWVAAAVALLFVVGFALWRNNLVSDPDPVAEIAAPPAEETTVEAAGADDLAPLSTTVSPAPDALPPPAPVNTAGQVVLTATSPVWMRIYDAADKVLFEKEMVTGERYIVPGDANNPQIRTGRADLITVTVDGKAVPALGPGQRTIKNVGISAAALAARAQTTPGALPVTPNLSTPAAVIPVRP
jgi:cytoskeleton protein RodZ